MTESVNRALVENFQLRMGKTAADFLGKDCGDLLAATGLSTEEIDARRSIYRRAVQEMTTLRFDAPPSELRDALEVSIYPVKDQQGICTHLLWNGRNISKRIQAEAGRRESEERYTLVTEAIHEGIFDWNILTGAYYLSPRYKEILGFRDDELPNDAGLVLRAHPSRRQRPHGRNGGSLQPRPYQGQIHRRTEAQAPGRHVSLGGFARPHRPQ